MKLLALLLGLLSISVLVMPLMLVAVIATHPWLAVGADVQAVEQQPAVAAVGTPVPAITPAANIVEIARQWLGVPYRWGGCTPKGVDCSCFVRNVLAAVGINAPRVTTEQIRWATPVSRDQLQVGDLVFFNDTCTNCGANPTHVGLYIGAGQMIQAGDPVQVSPVFSGIYAAHYAGAGRPH